MEQSIRPWCNFAQGSTIGHKGSESGLIVLDEEHPEGARISLERATSVAPFAITCGIYGWFFHTRYFSDEAEAKREYYSMKLALEQIIEGLPVTSSEKSVTSSEKKDAMGRSMKAIEQFVERFPT
jgi:hypothetical protein